ncbi:hypothetical protein SUDANB120_02742 [Streptomyces sp. enrichment culture]|uniref:hypothetical protein n=1 Tax=Streptomyces sp. enrichment culture TaxID=1795815 RepID=UPI003F557EFD
MTLGELPVVWSLPPEDARAGWRALCWSVGPSGALAVMLVQERDLRRSPYVKGWVGWSVAAPCDGLLVVVSDGEERRTPVTGIPACTSHLALLPGSRFLLASGRTFRDEEGAWGANAVVYSGEGQPVSRFCIGDDIDYLLTDGDGGIWTSYGDEGIYGGHPESGAGLARWDADGACTWNPGGRLPVWPLGGDAAATEGAFAWLAWHSHKGRFLSRVDCATGDVADYRNPLPDTDGIAVRGTRMLLTHRLHNRPSIELSRAELVGDAWVVTVQEKLRLPGRVVMRCAQGRDGVLCLRAGDTWTRIDA